MIATKKKGVNHDRDSSEALGAATQSPIFFLLPEIRD